MTETITGQPNTELVSQGELPQVVPKPFDPDELTFLLTQVLPQLKKDSGLQPSKSELEAAAEAKFNEPIPIPKAESFVAVPTDEILDPTNPKPYVFLFRRVGTAPSIQHTAPQPEQAPQSLDPRTAKATPPIVDKQQLINHKVASVIKVGETVKPSMADLLQEATDIKAEEDCRHRMIHYSSAPEKRQKEITNSFIRIFFGQIVRKDFPSGVLYLNYYTASKQEKQQFLTSLMLISDPKRDTAEIYRVFEEDHDLQFEDQEREVLETHGLQLHNVLDVTEDGKMVLTGQIEGSALADESQPWTYDHTLVSLATSSVKQYPKILAVLQQSEKPGDIHLAFERFSYWLERAEGGDAQERQAMQSFFEDNYPGHVPYRFDDIAKLQQDFQSHLPSHIVLDKTLFTDRFYRPEQPAAQAKDQLNLDILYVLTSIARHKKAVVSKLPGITAYTDFEKNYEIYVSDPKGFAGKLAAIGEYLLGNKPPAARTEAE